MTDFKNAQGRKNKYLDISRTNFYQEMLMCIIWESPNCNHLEVDQCIFFKKGRVKIETFCFKRIISSKGVIAGLIGFTSFQ